MDGNTMVKKTVAGGAGALVGATVGTVLFPGVGTVLGYALGTVIGGLAGAVVGSAAITEPPQVVYVQAPPAPPLK